MGVYLMFIISLYLSCGRVWKIHEWEIIRESTHVDRHELVVGGRMRNMYKLKRRV